MRYSLLAWCLAFIRVESRTLDKRQNLVNLPPPGTSGIGTTVVRAFNGAGTGESGGSLSTPKNQQQATPPTDINLTMLNFALTLENLQAQFYQDALAIFPLQAMQKAGLSTFQATAITQQIQRQLIDEQSHVQVLQAAIQGAGATPFAGCQFNFRSVLTDPVTFLSSARSIEAAGVSAYAGVASALTNPTLLGTLATIMPIEARHSSILNLFSGASATPQSFEVPLSPPQVLAIVGGLLQNCQASDLGLTANQPLSVIDGLTQSTLFTAGSILQFQTSAQIQSLQTNTLSCQMLIGGATTALVMPASSCIIPSQAVGGPINGIVAIYLTSNAQPLTTSLANQVQNVVAGPALLFVDSNKEEVLGQVFKVKALNLSFLPTANLASAALTPANSTISKTRGTTQAGGTKGNSSSPPGGSTPSTTPARKLKVQEPEKDESTSDTGMNHLGLNSDLSKTSWYADPKKMIQSPSQSGSSRT